jgi:hypothetical protein
MKLVNAFAIAAVIGVAALSAQTGLAATVKVQQQTGDVFKSSGALSPYMGALEIKFTDPKNWVGNKYVGPKHGGMAGALQLKTTLPGGKGISDFMAFCITPFVRLNTTFDSYEAISDLPGMSALLSTTQLRRLGGLARGAWSQITDTTSAVAFQFAVWEIVSETDATLGVLNGKFQLFVPKYLEPTPPTHNAAALADTWLAALGSADFKLGTGGLTIFHSDDTVTKNSVTTKATQDLMTYAPPAPVPLPGAFGLLALALGALVARGRASRPTA